ncbi:DUF6461 domain-containing protein [Kutzneria buriramensis]|uniref:Uncharacterized protein n=1 Tax=Kutzneria buriramensis TaxID=1045776 RepID=A0A3E0H0W6_9PSEU|nr:DUF6461 domain-containing protein [Kutzneria buriramensis]REH35251.1 hypothetical protein BCF44_118111 [Kutzneria buriramensis]
MYGPTTALPQAVLDAMAQVVAGDLSRVAQAIPPAPAAELGRLREKAPAPGRLGLMSPAQALVRREGQAARARQVAAPANANRAQQAAVRGGDRLGGLPDLLAERLLGALELTVAALDVALPDLVAVLPTLPDGRRTVSVATMSGGSAMSPELSKLDGFVPGSRDMAQFVVTELVTHPAIAPLLVATGEDETAIAASHGARHLALSVVATTVVLRSLWPKVSAPAIIGTALGIAAPILREAPMPAAYAEAELAKRRANYLMPRHSSGRAMVADHMFALAEGPVESTVDFSENGLVAVVPGGVAIRTGHENRSVGYILRIVEEPPVVEPDPFLWEEAVEVSWHAPVGGASIAGAGRDTAPPWPGDYRVRVCARGRDEGDERYELTVWRAPLADPLVHRASDRLGHVLRGEPEPPVVVPPEADYHWIESSSLSDAATITFVAGKSATEVLRDFGADPSAPASARELSEQGTLDPWVAVLDVPGGVVAVEYNGWVASDERVMRALSSPDTVAASMYWNVNALTRFSLAKAGESLASFELGLQEPSPAAEALLEDLDVANYGHRPAKGVFAAARFTGLSLSAEQLAVIESADVGYPILPLLPVLYADTRNTEFRDVPDDRLRDLAWWAAAFVVERSELTDHPAVAASLAARALTPEAELLARRSGLSDYREHHWLWACLHRATNPDARSAATGALEAARYAVPGAAAELLDHTRAVTGETNR